MSLTGATFSDVNKDWRLKARTKDLTFKAKDMTKDLSLKLIAKVNK